MARLCWLVYSFNEKEIDVGMQMQNNGSLDNQSLHVSVQTKRTYLNKEYTLP